MAPTLYMVHASPPVRAVLITAKAISLDLTLKEIDLLKGENRTPEYIKLNPQHTVPTLVDDDGFVIWDSHAIMIYIISKYAKNDALYPKDIKKRAIIDQRLHFESGVVFSAMRAIGKSVLFEGKNVIEESQKVPVRESYGFLEAFLKDKWMAGDSVSIADYSLVSSISSLNVVVPIEKEKFPKLADWLKRTLALPECEANKQGIQMFTEIFKSKVTSV